MVEPSSDDRFRHIHFAGAKSAPRRANAPRRPPLPPTSAGEDGRAPEHLGVAGDDGFLRWLLDQSGLDTQHYRGRPLRRRLVACLRMLKTPSAAEARRLLEQQPELLSVALNAVIIGSTDFFRDAPVWEELRHDVFPDLLKTRSGLSIWSAACSDGVELYSAAMLLAEAGRLEPSSLLGTDVRAAAIKQAEAGIYPLAGIEKIPIELRARYIHMEGRGARVAPVLRQRVRWQVSDVFACDQEAAWDVIFCRNLVIYLENRAAYALWARMGRALKPGGILVTGKAEKPPADLGWKPAGPCLYRREEMR